jgi:glutamate dehydrogenase (NAD(P)+)
VEDIFALGDVLGPAKVIHVSQPQLGLKGVLVVDNVACGPAIGGLRMAEDVSTGECARLARAMTMKNAAAGLPHGGGKSVLQGDPKMDRADKERLIRAFAFALRREEDYIFGPDMGTNEECMAWVKDDRPFGQLALRGGRHPPVGSAPPAGDCAGRGAAIPFAICPHRRQRWCRVRQVGKHTARFLAERG